MTTERETCEYCKRDPVWKDGLCRKCYDELKEAHKDDDYPRRGRI